jgi:hypothetical protein
MLIDFQPVFKRKILLLDFAMKYCPEDLRAATCSYVDTTLQIIRSVPSAVLFQIPEDPEADDPYASEKERHQGWSLAHLVLHVTASFEEGAAFSSLLARGIVTGGRLRYEQDWHLVNTSAEVIRRLEECRRIGLAYLDTWPDQPHLETFRIMPEKLNWMKVNAPTAFLNGLMHWHKHLEQFKKVADHIKNTSIGFK